MMNLVAAFIGFITGMVAGFTLSMFPAILPSDYYIRCVLAGVAGLVLGGLIGGITGEMNAATGQGGHKFIFGGVTGIIGGVMGITKLEIVWGLLHALHIRSPF